MSEDLKHEEPQVKTRASEDPPKTKKDLAPEFRDLVSELPKVGDRRRAVRLVTKGTILVFQGHERTYEAEHDLLMECEEEFTRGTYETWWKVRAWYTDTAVRAPTRWEKLKAWLRHPAEDSTLPRARVLKK